MPGLWLTLLCAAPCFSPLLAVAFSNAGSGTQKQDRTAIQRSVTALADAWNQHDARAFAMAFAEDADFTNVVGQSAHGRDGIEALHAPFFATIFKDSHLVATIRGVRFLTADLAAVDVDCELTGAKAPDGSPRPFRKTLINCVMARQKDGSWPIAVLHNSEIPVPYSCEVAPSILSSTFNTARKWKPTGSARHHCSRASLRHSQAFLRRRFQDLSSATRIPVL